MTKPNRVPQVLLSHTEGADELKPPWDVGSWQHRSATVYPASISHPEHFQPAFPYSLIRFIVVCIGLFSAAVPWTGGAGDAAVLESRAKHGASKHSPCSASRAGAVTAGKIQIPLRGSSQVFALQMCTGTCQRSGATSLVPP